MKKILVVVCFCLVSTSAFAECTMADNYAAQAKVRELLNKSPGELFEFKNMSLKQIGDEHWYIRTKLIPWAQGISDQCVRDEVIEYLTNSKETAEQFIRDKDHPSTNSAYENDTGHAIADGESKANTMKWPELKK